MKYWLLAIAVVCSSCAVSQETVRIRQIESNDQVIIRYDTTSRYIGVSIPLEFKFNNRSSQNLWIGGVDYYVPDEFGISGKYGLWSDALHKLKVNSQYTRCPYPEELNGGKYPNPGYYWVGYTHIITPGSDIQDSLRRYVEQIKLGSDFISVGTLKEFKAIHPTLTERLLGRDSVSFRVFDNNKIIDIIRMPIKY